MVREQLRNFFITTASLTITGCATVDPRPDYDRAAHYVADATTQSGLYRPDHDEDIDARVRELLDGGISTEEAVRICLLNHPGLQAAVIELGVARADLVQAGLLSNPSLSAALRLPSGGGLANVEASLAQNIADLWQIPSRKRAAGHALERTILLVARQASILASETKAAYYRAVAADRLRAIAVENREITGRLLETTRAREQAGADTAVDVNLAQSEVRDSELNVFSAQWEASKARSELAIKLGFVSTPDTLALLDSLPVAPVVIGDAAGLLNTALTQRLDLLAARAAVAQAEARLEEQRRRVFSRVDVGVELERGERRGAKEGPTDFIIGPGVSLDLPIFDQNQAQIAKAQYEHLQEEKLLDALTREITQETLLAVERAKIAVETDRFYQAEVLPLRRSSLELAREAYQAGKLSIPVVLDAQRTLLTSRAAAVEAQEKTALALIDLEKVIGHPVANVRQGP